MEELTQKVKKQIEAYNSGDKMNYWAAPTACREAQAKYGAENIFMISSGYSSHYHDDYATFTYYNQATGEEFKDSWATAYACPAYGAYECMSIEEASKNGLLDRAKHLAIYKKQLIEAIQKKEMDALYPKDWCKYHLTIVVKGGRKYWNGTGIAVDHRSKKWSYYNTTTYVDVYEPETNLIHEVDAKYCTPVLDVEEWRAWKLSIVEKELVDDGGDYFNMWKEVRSKIFYIESWLQTKANEVDLSTAKNPTKEAREKASAGRKAAFKEKKMAELVEWVKTKTDKKGDEIMELAEHIWNKRYESA